MVLIPTFASEMSGVLSKLLDEQFLPSVACSFFPIYTRWRVGWRNTVRSKFGFVN